jgi:dipeptide/tripeptide permease
VVGLELAFAAAPATMKSFITACWLFTVFLGDAINIVIAPLYNETFWGISLTPDWYFLIFAVLMVPVTVAFAIVARRFNRPAA